jgi:excisionase family DNA binding protein
MISEEKIRQMLTVNEVSQILHIHHNTVRRWANQGILKTYRVTSRGDRRFMREDIDRFLSKFNSKNN